MSAAVEVRVNLWKVGAVAVGGFGAAFGFFVAIPDGADFLLEFLCSAVAGCLLLWGVDALQLLWFRRFLRFEPEAGRITVRPGTNRLAVYPSKGFEQVEYSSADGWIYEVGADGSRRRLPVRRWFMNRADWNALVEALIEHHSRL